MWLTGLELGGIMRCVNETFDCTCGLIDSSGCMYRYALYKRFCDMILTYVGLGLLKQFRVKWPDW